MILPVFEPASLAEYIKSGARQIPRPQMCPRCGAKESFWKHDSFEREAFEGELSASIRIQRLLCRACGVTVSCLFAFLVPYKRATAALIAQAATDYGTKRMTYREEAEQLSPLESEEPPTPSHSQVFKWVQSLCCRSEYLLLQAQKEIVLVGSVGSLDNIVGGQCPNAKKAHTIEKARMLNALAELICASKLFEDGCLRKLYTYFLSHVESLQAIFCERLIRLLAPQRMKHVIW
jgi:hypothetical protein